MPVAVATFHKLTKEILLPQFSFPNSKNTSVYILKTNFSYKDLQGNQVAPCLIEPWTN